MKNSEKSHMIDLDNEESRRLAVLRLAGVPFESCMPAIFEALGDCSWRVRKEAVELLVSCRPDTAQTGMLLEFLRDADNAGLRNAAAEALARLGKKSVPSLLSHLHDPDNDVRKLVIDILAAIGGQDAVSGLIGSLDDDDVNVASAAAEGLGISGSQTAISPLLKALERHPHDFFRFNVLTALGRIGIPSPLPPFIKELASVEILRRGVYECLGRIGCDMAAADIVLEGVMSTLPSIRNTAICSLASVMRQIDPLFLQPVADRLSQLAVEEGLAERLAESYNNAGPELARAIVTLMGIIGGPIAISVLFKALNNENLAALASRMLERIGKDSVDAAIMEFSKGDDQERANLCLFLAEHFGTEENAVRTIEKGLEDKSDMVRRSAVIAVGKMSGTELVRKVTKLVDDPSSLVRDAALQTLGIKCGSDSSIVAETALFMKCSKNPELRQGAALLLVSTGDYRNLTDLMKDISPMVREAAVRAAGRMRAESLSSALVIMLADESADVRVAAAESLGACGDSESIQHIRIALKDKDSWVQAAALRSLIELVGADAMPDLMSLWSGCDNAARLACIEAFDLLGDWDGFLAISDVMETLEVETLKSAIDILARHAEDLLRDHYGYLFGHSDWCVRIAAVKASCTLPLDERDEMLRSVLENEPHDLVRLEIQRLLDR